METMSVVVAPQAIGKPIVLCDLDGTLADCTHRLGWLRCCKGCGRPEHLGCNTNCQFTFRVRTEHTRFKDWRTFFKLCSYDKPIEHIVKWVRALPPDYELWIVSGRSSEVLHETQRWLEWQQIPYSRLIMRDLNDKRADDIVKQEFLDQQIPKERVAFVIDDRTRVVEMWRRNGLTVYQVAPGDF